MHNFVHLHVHTQYSLLDGQASIARLVDKAIADGQQGLALTDHGNMFGVKEFFNYINKKNGARKDKIKSLKSLIEKLETGNATPAEMGDDAQASLAKARAELDALPVTESATAEIRSERNYCFTHFYFPLFLLISTPTYSKSWLPRMA